MEKYGVFVPVFGMVKDSKHRTRSIATTGGDIVIKSNRRVFTLITNIQDEVHRFAITFHREKRSKRQTASELDSIKGIGEKSKQALLQHFKSVKRIREATVEEIAAVIGKAKAEIIVKSLTEKA